jgi:hypothetical protein
MIFDSMRRIIYLYFYHHHRLLQSADCFSAWKALASRASISLGYRTTYGALPDLVGWKWKGLVQSESSL